MAKCDSMGVQVFTGGRMCLLNSCPGPTAAKLPVAKPLFRFSVTSKSHLMVCLTLDKPPVTTFQRIPNPGKPCAPGTSKVKAA